MNLSTLGVLSIYVLGACASPNAPTVPATTPTPLSPGAASQPVKSRGQSIVDARDRDEADKALDRGRAPAEFLSFIDVQPGMKVAELMAGGGYTAELLARAVGESGEVYGQNSKFILERFAERPWSERLKKPVMKNVVRVDRELEDPLPPEARGRLDLITLVLFYHDTVWLNVDRAKMNKAIFDALKPGGSFIVIDHSARDGSGVADAQALHRIDERMVREEILAAGFVLGSEGRFLRNAADGRDWNASPTGAAERRGSSDRFVLEFKKRPP